MSRLVTGAAVIAVAGLTAHAVAAGKSFMGQPAPEIQVQDWINGDGRTNLADLRGEVVLLEFWKTH